MDIGRKIILARKELGKEFTQEKLTNELVKCGLEAKRSWLAAIESGRIKSLDRHVIEALSKVLKKPLEYFGDVEIKDIPVIKLNFPPLLRTKIDEEANKRFINAETLIVIIVSEYFTKHDNTHKNS